MVKPYGRAGTFKPRIPIRIGSGLARAGGYGDFFLIGLATLPAGIPRASAFLRPSPPLRACPGFSLVLTVHGLLIAGASLAENGLLGIWASVVAARGLSSCCAWALVCRLSSRGTQALLPRGT